jgi:hypothetical protein
MSETRPRGNPVQRRQGVIVRGILMGLVNKRPAPLDEVMQLTGKSRTTIINHLARLQESRRIAGYTTKGGIVRVWNEDRE